MPESPQNITRPARMYYAAGYVAGRQYWQADEAWSSLTIGSPLSLRPEPENSHDPWAVAIWFVSEELEFKLGYLPKGKNRTVFTLLSMGWEKALDCRVSRLDPTGDYDRQIGFTLSILPNLPQPSTPTE